jgi:PAS domain S-box-containing protein
LGRLTARLSRKPVASDYLLAVGLALLAVAGHAILDMFVPGSAYFILLFPALVIAGVFCGTGPAALAAVTGGILTFIEAFGTALLAWPPNGSQINALMFCPAAAIVLWATAILRRTASQAADAEARLVEVFRQVPGAGAILEAPNGRLLLRSANSDAVLGQPEGKIDQSDDLTVYGGLHPNGRPYGAADYPIVRALQTGEVVVGEPLIYRRPDGRLADLEVYAGPVRDPGGTIVASVGMAFDVSERVAAERRLQESEARARAAAERLAAAIDAGALGTWEVDLRTDRIRIDAIFARMLGLPPEPMDVPRVEFRRFVHPDDRRRSAGVLDCAIESGGSYSDELHMCTDQGEERWFATRGAILSDMQRVIGVISDLTERRQREDALREAVDARDLLMREADHRIKNSLQLVVSLLSLQTNRVADPDAKAALRAAIARVEAIADAHLALQQSPDLRIIEIDRMLLDLCERVGALNPAVHISCAAQVGRAMDADQAIPLGLLASEVLTNALRHAYPPGMPGAVTLTAAVQDGALSLVIADGGAGMPVGIPRRRGLGSTLIASLSRQIGATVDTDSRPGAGTTVRLAMPLPTELGAAERVDAAC